MLLTQNCHTIKILSKNNIACIKNNIQNILNKKNFQIISPQAMENGIIPLMNI